MTSYHRIIMSGALVALAGGLGLLVSPAVAASDGCCSEASKAAAITKAAREAKPASDAKAAKPEAAAVTTQAPASGGGLVISIDEKGNRVTPTSVPVGTGPATTAALKAGMPAQTTIEKKADGLMIKRHGAGTLSASTATVGSDGKVQVNCQPLAETEE